MDSKVFDSANTIAEITVISRRLKSEGEDVMEVNRLASERKRAIIISVNKVNTLKKIALRSSAVPRQNESLIQFESILNLSGSSMVINYDKTIIM